MDIAIKGIKGYSSASYISTLGQNTRRIIETAYYNGCKVSKKKQLLLIFIEYLFYISH